MSLLLKWEVSFTDLHASQERFFPPHCLDLPSASILGNTDRTRWSLRLLSFLNPIVGTFVKTAIPRNTVYQEKQFTKKYHSQTTHCLNRDSQGLETFLAPSADKETCNSHSAQTVIAIQSCISIIFKPIFIFKLLGVKWHLT